MKALLQKHPLQEEGPKVYIVRSGADAIVSRFRKVFERDEKQRTAYGWKPEENVFDTEVEAAEFLVKRAKERLAKARDQVSVETRRLRKCEQRLARIGDPK